MDEPGDFPARVGRQLARRRDEDLDLTQDELADLIGITTAAISKAERGINKISRGRRSGWETALQLPPGSISQAYRSGELIVEAEVEAAPGRMIEVPAEDLELLLETLERLQRRLHGASQGQPRAIPPKPDEETG